ncbi:putative arabinose 5-phosphate isomerase [Platanthera zijinensis]|uniref:Arabinose 5-phosphate isomerase n=1 Tax=Platanthera zijinensis TaxID=2320716 RepID=A0AAP0B1Q9_9ASPA
MEKMESSPSAVQFLPVIDDQRLVISINTLHGQTDHPSPVTGLPQLADETSPSLQHHLDHFFDNLDLDHAQAFAQALVDAPDAIFFSGIGKSGFVANKLSQTLASLGFIRSTYPPPIDALHGGIDAIFPTDILVLISKSISSDELLNLFPNPIAAICDMNVHLPLEREICPFGLAPVTSTSIQMVFGDTVVAAIMRIRGLTKDQYARNHPAGKIGKSLIFKASLSTPTSLLFHCSQKHHLHHFFDNLDLDQAQAFAHALVDAPDAILFSGIGKSGFIANNLSQTLASLGFIRSAYLPPINALHGDIDAIFPAYILVLISKSGSSDKLLNLVPCARAKGAYMISITSVDRNPLASICDMNIHLPLEREICPFGLTPIVFGDTVVATITRARGLTKEQFEPNHPARKIGKSLLFKVKDLMKKEGDLPLSKEGDMIVDQLSELTSKGCGCLLVVDAENHLIRIFTDGDLIWESFRGLFSSNKDDAIMIDRHTLDALFKSQKNHLNHFFDNHDLEQAQAFAQALVDAPDAIFFSGVGKSGFLANKLSKTLTSLGFIRSAYLPPIDALHDDISAIFPTDILVLISKSGFSDELLNLVPCARAKGAYLISITSVN